MRRTFLRLLPFALLALTAPAQGEEACSKIPAGWKIEARAKTGALCADILLKAGEDGIRKLRVFEAEKPGFETEDAALCKSCGGVLGDPFQDFKWRGSTLSVNNHGGSREAWGETWKFAKRDNRWIITGWDRSVTDRGTNSIWQESVNALTGKATAQYDPGEGECGASAENAASCRKSTKMKPKKLSCSHPARAPDARTVNQWREQAFACGLKTL